MRATLTASLSLAVLVACNFGPPKDDVGTDDTGPGTDDSDPGPDGTTIAEAKALGPDADVVLPGLIVTSGPNFEGNGFFVQQAGGGANSCIYVFVPAGLEDLYLEPGYKINVSGTMTNYYDWLELSVASSTAIEVVGQGEVTVEAVDPATVLDWEPYESCLISVGAVAVTSQPDNYGEVSLDNGLMMDDLLYDFSTEQGATYTNVTGQLGYSYSAWKLFPRAESDLEGYVPGEGPGVVTVSQIQQGEVSEDSSVSLEGVVVTSALNAKGDGFFIADAAGGAWSGIYVFLGPDYSGEVPEVGAVLNMSGTVVEFYDMTELKDVEFEVVGTGAVPAPEVLTSAPADWEPYEGVEVMLMNITVDDELNEYGELATDWDIVVDNLFFDFDAAQGGTWGSLTGHITYSFEAWKVNPDSVDDFAN